ncbi:hypothetical protein [Pectinatus sottacetonis]|uniref:hypothetical protein n=1 Tax=Pectinatus sottacetonis TaxID=1002795 RepID=UPI0018C4E15F|nr:hypothetical protein [Pectinatus sottacetonis]
MGDLIINDFLTGDIILFKVDFNSPNTEWISKAIALLTKSDVSHAALYMGKISSQKIACLSDEGLKGLSVHEITPAYGSYFRENKNPRPVYIRRMLIPVEKNPVMKAAYNYIEQDEPYDIPGLVMVGLILLYRDCPVHLLPVSLISKIFAMGATILDNFIQQYLHPGKKPMICSQYVFQCYQDAGGAYPLQVAVSDNSRSGLIDIVCDNFLQQDKFSAKLQRMYYDEESIIQLVKILHKNNFVQLNREKVNNMLNTDSVLVQNIINFVDRFYCILSNNNSTDISLKEKLQKLQINKALFVTPADIKNCTNLVTTGSSCIYRSEENFQ